MLISRHALSDYIRRDMNSYTWMKKLTREQIERELKSLKVKPRFKTDPWLHQLVCFYIALCEPRFLFLLDMGLGKTKLIADVMTQLFRERKATQALITVPRMINMDSWSEDLERHSELEPWLCNISDIEEKWDRLAHPKGEVSIIDYQGLHLATTMKRPGKKKGKYTLVKDEKKIKHLQRTYDFIGIDESHKLGNHDSLWFSIMRQLTKTADHCYATTGTLFGSDLEAAWSQFYLVDRGETFGENLGLFRGSFFDATMNPWKGTIYTPKKGMARPFNRMLQNRSLRYDENEVHDLPARVPRSLVLGMGSEQREHYLRAVEGVINAGGKLSELDSAWLRMRQITSGYLKWKDEHGDHKLVFKDNPKLMAIERLIDNLGASKIVIAYDYTDSGQLISEKLQSMGVGHEWYYGGTKDKSASRRRFLDDPKCRAFVMNSEAGGTGTDGLQKVAKYLAFYESPSSPITRKQTIKRIHRPGQTERSFIYDLLCKGTVDGTIMQGAQDGIDFYEQVVAGKVTKSMLLGFD